MSDFGPDINSVLAENKKKRDAANAAKNGVASATMNPDGSPKTAVQSATAQSPAVQQPAPGQSSGSSHITEIAKPAASTPLQENQSTAPASSSESTTKSQQAVPNEKKVEEKKDADQPAAESKEKTDVEKQQQDKATTEDEFEWDKGLINTDESGPAAKESDQPSFDFKKLGSALNIEAKTEEDFVKAVNDRFTKLKNLEESSASFEGLPDELRSVIDIAKKGGDWMAYASSSSFNPDRLDPVEIFDMEFKRSEIQNYTREDGSIDYDKMDEDLASIPTFSKRMQGNIVKQGLVNRHNQEKAMIAAKAAQVMEKFNNNLTDAANDLPKLLPKETFGISIEPKHSSYFYDGISNGSLIKKHLGNLDISALSKTDAKKIIKTIALAELGDRISELRYKQGEVAGKKGLLKDTQNPVITAPTHLPAPSAPTDEVPKTTAQMLRDRNSQFQPKGSL